MVFQMSVRYTDSCGDTGSSSEREKKNLFHPDYHRRAVLDGSCRHNIWSMKHSVWGTVYINGEKYSFDNAEGYWEGDRGQSFPKEYIWTQCSFSAGAFMLSVADIPMSGFHFRGIIGVVVLNGREYRLATYPGAKTAEIRNGLVRVIQGRLELEAELLEKTGKPLKAPAKGQMVRIIHESAACPEQ